MTYLDDALALDPDNFEILLVRGAVLAELHLQDEAESDRKQSLAIYDHVETVAMLVYVSAAEDCAERKQPFRSLEKAA